MKKIDLEIRKKYSSLYPIRKFQPLGYHTRVFSTYSPLLC